MGGSARNVPLPLRTQSTCAIDHAAGIVTLKAHEAEWKRVSVGQPLRCVSTERDQAGQDSGRAFGNVLRDDYENIAVHVVVALVRENQP